MKTDITHNIYLLCNLCEFTTNMKASVFVIWHNSISLVEKEKKKNYLP